MPYMQKYRGRIIGSLKFSFVLHSLRIRGICTYWNKRNIICLLKLAPPTKLEHYIMSFHNQASRPEQLQFIENGVCQRAQSMTITYLKKCGGLSLKLPPYVPIGCYNKSRSCAYYKMCTYQQGVNPCLWYGQLYRRSTIGNFTLKIIVILLLLYCLSEIVCHQ